MQRIKVMDDVYIASRQAALNNYNAVVEKSNKAMQEKLAQRLAKKSKVVREIK